jgi:twitching motility protein PilT
MITIEELLSVAKSKGASDLHITVGIPPKCRINGELKNLDYPKFSPSDTNDLISPMLTDHFKEVLESKGEVDFSYSIARLGRYRVNVFKQRGSYAMVIRLVGVVIPSPESLGVPESVI